METLPDLVQSPIYTSSWVSSNTSSQLHTQFKTTELSLSLIKVHLTTITTFHFPTVKSFQSPPTKPWQGHFTLFAPIKESNAPLDLNFSPKCMEETPIWTYSKLFPPLSLSQNLAPHSHHLSWEGKGAWTIDDWSTVHGVQSWQSDTMAPRLLPLRFPQNSTSTKRFTSWCLTWSLTLQEKKRAFIHWM